MKRYIRSSVEKAEAYDFYYNEDVRRKMFSAANKAKEIQKQTGAYAVCYAVAFDRNGANELEYDSDGCLFKADTYEDYRQFMYNYCNGRPENMFEFYTEFDRSADSTNDIIDVVYEGLRDIADQYPGMYLVSKGKGNDMVSISNYKYKDSYNSNHNEIYVFISDSYSQSISFDKSGREKIVNLRSDCSEEDLNELYSFVSRWAKRNQ